MKMNEAWSHSKVTPDEVLPFPLLHQKYPSTKKMSLKRFEVGLCYLLVALAVQVKVANAGPIPCPNDVSIQGYTNKTILNEDIVKFQGDSTNTLTTCILCPGTTFRYTSDDMESLYLHHANTILQCGADGSSSNNCVLELAGSTVLELLVVFGNNSLVQGLTFTQDSEAKIEYQSGIANVYNSLEGLPLRGMWKLQVCIFICLFQHGSHLISSHLIYQVEFKPSRP